MTSDLILKSILFVSKIILAHGLIYLKESGQVSSAIPPTCKVMKKRYLKQYKKDFCGDKKWHHYICKKMRLHKHKKYKDFQLSIIRD